MYVRAKRRRRPVRRSTADLGTLARGTAESESRPGREMKDSMPGAAGYEHQILTLPSEVCIDASCARPIRVNVCLASPLASESKELGTP